MMPQTIAKIGFLVTYLVVELGFTCLMVLVIRYGLGLSTIADDLEKINGYLARFEDKPLDSGRPYGDVHLIIPDNPESAG